MNQYESNQNENENQWGETQGNIKCCLCGIPIPSNPSNMCVTCIRNQVDITDGISKQMHINQCRGCNRYLVPPNQWVVCDLESRELLTVCVKKIKGLKNVKLVDASFVYTEPHSRRLKVKITIQKEVFVGTILQQAFIVEYTVMNQQCTECERFEAKDTWNAVVQLRQKTDHKKTFFWLEQLILKHNAHAYVSKMKEMSDGLDFFFTTKQHAKKFCEFLCSVVPVRMQTSEKLISADVHSNTANFKYSFSVEIVPICRDDFVCLPPALVRKMGGVSPLYICSKVTNSVHLIDPTNLKTLVLSSQLYWNYPFKALNSRKDLVEFMVLDVRPTGPKFGKFALAEIQVAKIDEMSSSSKSYFGYTHLGNILECGSHVWGYLTETCVYNDFDVKSVKNNFPSVVIISKSYPKRRKKKNLRYWKLKSLAKEEDQLLRKNEQKKKENEYEEFLDELEEDPEMRGEINLYKVQNAEQIYKNNKEKNNTNDEMQDSGEDDDDDDDDNNDDFPEVKLSELIEDLNINK